MQRASWPLSYCAIEHPEFVENHFEEMISNLHASKVSNAVKRNTLRLLQYMEIPEASHGDVMNLCFGYITSAKEAPANKAFAITILEGMSQHYPEIKDEVKIIIEDRWETETPAFRSRAKKFLQASKKG